MISHILATACEPGDSGYCAPGTDSFLFSHVLDMHLGNTDVYVSKIQLLMFFGVVAVCVFFVIAARRRALVPGKLQFFGESYYSFVRDGMCREVIGHEGYRFAPYLASLMIFIFSMNFFGILPLAQVPVTGLIEIPAFLALLSYVIFNYVGIRKHGAGRYFAMNLFPPGVPKGMYVLLTPIEAFSTFVVRPFTLAIRLFANMFAGHLLLLVFTTGTIYLLKQGGISLVWSGLSLVMTVVLTFFEALVETLQAYIFTILTAVYISGALADEH